MGPWGHELGCFLCTLSTPPPPPTPAQLGQFDVSISSYFKLLISMVNVGMWAIREQLWDPKDEEWRLVQCCVWHSRIKGLLFTLGRRPSPNPFLERFPFLHIHSFSEPGRARAEWGKRIGLGYPRYILFLSTRGYSCPSTESFKKRACWKKGTLCPPHWQQKKLAVWPVFTELPKTLPHNVCDLITAQLALYHCKKERK